MGLLDFLFPKYCVSCRKFGHYLCVPCFAKIVFLEQEICLYCNKNAFAGLTHPFCQKTKGIDGVFASLIYQGVVKKLIFSFKYKPFVSDLRNTLGEFFYEGLIQKESFMALLNQDIVLTFVPLFPRKERTRGYNQAELLARDLGVKFGLKVYSLLERTRNTSTQFKLSKEERKANVKNAFRVGQDREKLFAGKIVCVVDDVFTSGATFLEIAKVLKQNGALKVYGLALSHGQ